jgi:hypothetical protein
MKLERDNARQIVLDQKTRIAGLQDQALMLDQLTALLRRLMMNFQASQLLRFVDKISVLEDPGPPAKQSIPIIRTAVNRVTSHHEKLASRYELELQKNLFEVNQQVTEKKKLLAREKQLLTDTQNQSAQTSGLIRKLKRQKQILMKTALLQRSALIKHHETDTIRYNQLKRKSDFARAENFSAQDSLRRVLEAETDLTKRIEDRMVFEERKTQMHLELAKTAEDLQQTLQHEAYKYNRAAAKLDRARDELVNLTRCVESYRDNLKTRELLDAELENKRLRAVINIEKQDFDKKLEFQKAKGAELRSAIDTLSQKVESLNQQISTIEQKLRRQMMKVPDFDRLHEALDRQAAASRRHLEFVTKRKYVLEDVRKEGERVDEEEIEASKIRMRGLSVRLPFESEEKEMKENERWSELAEINRRQAIEFAETLADIGITPFDE